MIDVRVVKFQSGEKCAVEIENFKPKCGLESFVIDFSKYLGAELSDWSRSWEFGLGYMKIDEIKIMLVHSEFPHVFSFDCPDESLAKELKKSLKVFFESEAGHRFV
jgi:hypothetical protein